AGAWTNQRKNSTAKLPMTLREPCIRVCRAPSLALSAASSIGLALTLLVAPGLADDDRSSPSTTDQAGAAVEAWVPSQMLWCFDLDFSGVFGGHEILSARFVRLDGTAFTETLSAGTSAMLQLGTTVVPWVFDQHSLGLGISAGIRGAAVSEDEGIERSGVMFS